MTPFECVIVTLVASAVIWAHGYYNGFDAGSQHEHESIRDSAAFDAMVKERDAERRVREAARRRVNDDG